MNTQSVPLITSMQVIPVAGYDSMLMNIGGAHGPYFTRNIVILTDSAGHVGVGEAPGGSTIENALKDACAHVEGRPISILNRIVNDMHQGYLDSDYDTFGKGAWTFELRVNAVAALESALLDLMGQFLNVPVAELLGGGKQRDEVTVLGYLFYIGDDKKTDLPYDQPIKTDHEWYNVRRRQAMTVQSVLELAEIAKDR